MSEQERKKPGPGPVQPQGPADPRVLHAPWRDSYLQGLSEQESAASARARSGEKPASSFLVAYWRTPERDRENHVVARIGEGPAGGMILLNRYPYANGHLLVALGEPRPTLHDDSAEQRAAFWRLVDSATLLVERALEPQGLNIGVNQGRAAGAGVPDHLHAHLVPRWNGDVNYFTVIGGVRVNPSALEAVAERMRETWSRLRAAGAV
jgi:ATP adenylyltransferase